MIDRIINTYVENLRSKGITCEPSFVGSEVGRVSSILELANLPQRVTANKHISTLSMPRGLTMLYDKFEDCCYSQDSALVCLNSYKTCPYVVSLLIEKLYKRCLIEDVTIPTVLYIDTEELVSDLGKLLAKSKNNNDTAPTISYTLDIIYNYIYTAKYVFWDRFSLDFSMYYSNYIYEILKRRYNNCLGNMYFTTKPYKNFCESFDINTLDILNIQTGIFQLAEEERQSKIILVEEG